MFGFISKTDLFFNARSIAVVGAAREEFKVGHILFKNLVANKSLKVYPVNPKASEIMGNRSYSDILEIPYPLDLVVIAVKADLVTGIMRQCVQRKVRSVIIISAGFSEVGNTTLEKEVKEIADSAGISFIGPNVLGIVNPYKELNASFFQGITEKGKIAFLSQSGALGVGVLDIAMKEKIGLSGFVSLGNSSSLDVSDFVEHFGKDKNTEVMMLYLESLKENKGHRFIEVCKRFSKNKMILAIKSGKSEEGKKAANSHTAALASESGVYEGIFKQAGVVEVSSLREMFSIADIYTKIGKIGKRACIVTNAGGLGVLASDVCSLSGLEVPELPEKTKEKLGEILPAHWSHNNPVDVLGDALAERYSSTLKLLDKESFFDFFIVLLTPQYMTQPFETAQIFKELKKPVIACFVGGEKIQEAGKFMRENKVPYLDDVSDFRILGKLIF